LNHAVDWAEGAKKVQANTNTSEVYYGGRGRAQCMGDASPMVATALAAAAAACTTTIVGWSFRQ